MAIKASTTITISKYRDTNSITRYYILQSSTASVPSKPTTQTPPSGWTTTEPSYSSGSTNTLYFTDRYIFSDGTFAYTDVSKSSSYEAAKEAWNKAQNAQDSIDNMEIGGRNYISNLSKNWKNGHYALNNNGVWENYSGRICVKEPLEVIPNETILIKLYQINITGKVLGFRTYGENDEYIGSLTGITNELEYKVPPNVYKIRVFLYEKVTLDMLGMNIRIKIERGNKFTDWTPSPEDVDSEIGDKVSNDIYQQDKEENNQRFNTAQQTIDSIQGIIANLVRDSNGESLMEQDGSGWKFSMKPTEEALEQIKKELLDEMAERSRETSGLQSSVNNLDYKTAYINVGKDLNGDPAIELGESTSNFKVIISNRKIEFRNGSIAPAYIDGNIFYGENMTVKKELKIGENPGFVWRVRENGNFGLSWVE